MSPRLARQLPTRFPRPAKPPLPASRRHFFPLPAGPITPQRFTTTRTLPHAPGNLFKLVSDIDSYHKFLPYCLGSRVTRRTGGTGGLPAEADLRVGWGSFDETFRSRVTCLPEKGIVEANGDQNVLFEKLTTRWEIAKVDGDGDAGGGGDGGGRKSEVSLFLEFQFRNPLYAAVSTTAAPVVARVMVEAFERRAQEVLGGGEVEVEVDEGTRAVGGGGSD